MGTDKALLPYRGATLIQCVASAVRDAAGSVTIVGSPEKYQGLGMRIVQDLRPDCGPLAGIETALGDSSQDWVLIAACDMPGATVEFFRNLWGAQQEGAEAVIPVTPDGRLHPLAAFYHRSAGPAVSGALDRGIRKVLDALQPLQIQRVAVSELSNANTPDEWAALRS